MCRLYGFQSRVDSSVHQSLVVAENALGRQSILHPDGWGVAYYIDSFPHIIRNDERALEDKLFRDISAVVSTKTLLAHVRQATGGRINILNCHPFQYGPWLLAHNGEIYGFWNQGPARKALINEIDIKFKKCIFGDTDTEVTFYLFLTYLKKEVGDVLNPNVSLFHICEALRNTIKTINQYAPTTPNQLHRLTFIITNGKIMLGFREQRDLYFSTHKTVCPEREVCPEFDSQQCEQAIDSGTVKHLIITSEQIQTGPNVWQQLSHGEYVGVDQDMRLRRGWLDPNHV